VDIDDASIAYVKTNHLPPPNENLAAIGYRYGLYWPRLVYGRLVRELAAERATVVGLDVIFAERREDHPSVQMADGTQMESDDFFSLQLRQASNVVIAVSHNIHPLPMFATNAAALGDISADKDRDGVLRQACAFRLYTNWNFAFRQVAGDSEYGVDLSGPNSDPARRRWEFQHVGLHRRQAAARRPRQSEAVHS
jgi:CHASE2 domain-containing sensor protein